MGLRSFMTGHKWGILALFGGISDGQGSDREPGRPARLPVTSTDRSGGAMGSPPTEQLTAAVAHAWPQTTQVSNVLGASGGT